MKQAEVIKKPEPGLHQGLSYDEYASWDAANASILACFARSAMHARQELIEPCAPTTALDLGAATHLAILEPDRFEEQYLGVEKIDRRTRVGKARWQQVEREAAGRTVLRHAEYESCQAMSRSIWHHRTARRLLSAASGMNEVSVLWRDEWATVAGEPIACKARLDRITSYDGWTTVCDLKTCTDASPDAFGRDAARHHYALKAAFYLRGLDVLSPRKRRFVFCAIEKTPPYGVALYELEPAALDLGRQMARSYLRQLARAMESNEWPGYPERVMTLGLPRWAYDQAPEGDS